MQQTRNLSTTLCSGKQPGPPHISEINSRAPCTIAWQRSGLGAPDIPKVLCCCVVALLMLVRLLISCYINMLQLCTALLLCCCVTTLADAVAAAVAVLRF